MRAFRGLHGQIDNQVELDGDLVYLNRLEGPWDKHVVAVVVGEVLVVMWTIEGNGGI